MLQNQLSSCKSKKKMVEETLETTTEDEKIGQTLGKFGDAPKEALIIS